MILIINIYIILYMIIYLLYIHTYIIYYIHLCIPYSYITCICLHFSFAPMLKWNLQLAGSGRSRARRGNQVDDWEWSMGAEPHLYRLIKSCLCALPGNVAAFSGSSKCLRVPGARGSMMGKWLVVCFQAEAAAWWGKMIKGSLVANFRYTNFWVAWQE